MKTDSYLMSFDELVRYLEETGIKNWHGVLTLHAGDSGAAGDELNERLRNTWWEICWPDNPKTKQPICRYLADSLRDALRLRPSISLSASSALNHSGPEFFDMFDLWQDEEDEYVEYCCRD